MRSAASSLQTVERAGRELWYPPREPYRADAPWNRDREELISAVMRLEKLVEAIDGSLFELVGGTDRLGRAARELREAMRVAKKAAGLA